MPECDTRIRHPSGMTDFRTALNQYVNRAIIRSRIASGGIVADMIDNVYAELGGAYSINPLSSDFNKSRIEAWAETQPGTVVYPLQQRWTKFAGVHGWSTWSRLTWGNTAGTGFIRVISPTVLVNGFYIGLDKLGHFMQQGYYYHVMVAREGRTLGDAEQWGHETECVAGIAPGGALPQPYGLVTTGVYSLADLEANRRGYDFYTALAARPAMRFDIANYISERWNEERYISAYHENVAPRVWANVLKGTWTGTFTIRDDPRNPSIYLQAGFNPGAPNIQGFPMTGGFIYTFDAGRVTVWLNATVQFIPFIGGSLGYRGITVDFSWRQGNNTGRGRLAATTSESALEGTWGRGTSSVDGGNISLTRR